MCTIEVATLLTRIADSRPTRRGEKRGFKYLKEINGCWKWDFGSLTSQDHWIYCHGWVSSQGRLASWIRLSTLAPRQRRENVSRISEIDSIDGSSWWFSCDWGNNHFFLNEILFRLDTLILFSRMINRCITVSAATDRYQLIYSLKKIPYQGHLCRRLL